MSKGKIVLNVVGHQIPSFKNRKRAILDRNTGKMRTLTEPSVKKRMDLIENAILSELYSSVQIREGETHSECLKRLRIALSGLCDDSTKEIPQGQWETIHHVTKGKEGAIIEIEEL